MKSDTRVQYRSIARMYRRVRHLNEFLAPLVTVLAILQFFGADQQLRRHLPDVSAWIGIETNPFVVSMLFVLLSLIVFEELRSGLILDKYTFPGMVLGLAANLCLTLM